MEPTFGTMLRSLRQRAGLSQRDLAQRAGLDFSYLSKIETGRLSPPAADTIVLLCSFLGVAAEELLALTHKLPSEVAVRISGSCAAQLFLREAQDLTEEQWQQLTQHLLEMKKES